MAYVKFGVVLLFVVSLVGCSVMNFVSNERLHVEVTLGEKVVFSGVLKSYEVKDSGGVLSLFGKRLKYSKSGGYAWTVKKYD